MRIPLKFLSFCFALLLSLQVHAAPDLVMPTYTPEGPKLKDLKFVSCEKAKVGMADMLVGPFDQNSRHLDVARVLVINVYKKSLPLLHTAGLALVFQDHRTTYWDNMCVVIIGFGSVDATQIRVTTETKDEVRFELQTKEFKENKEPGGRDEIIPGRLLKVRMDILGSKVTLE